MGDDKAAVEEKIRETLRVANDAMTLSDQLFSPQGLFNELARTEAERREVAASDLFKEAQRRLSDLQRQEADEFTRSIQSLPAPAEQRRVLKLERS